jgi:lantibiotic modifying enzyme
MLPALENGSRRQDLREDLERAVATTWREGFGLSHSLCHGDLGNLELLLDAARGLGDRRLEARALRLADAVMDRIEAEGPDCGQPDGLESAGLMTGLSGIGYGLLRLSDPRRVPSILSLEPPRPRPDEPAEAAESTGRAPAELVPVGARGGAPLETKGARS